MNNHKILVVIKGAKPANKIDLLHENPFLADQIESLQNCGVLVDLFVITGSGLWGYIQGYFRVRKHITESTYSGIHAHYGISAIVAVTQLKLPSIITFMGSDVHLPINRVISKLLQTLSAHNIFVSDRLRRQAGARSNYSVVPYGLNLSRYFPVDQKTARVELDIPHYKKIILFSSSFDNKVKNYPLAKDALSYLPDIQLIELKKNFSNNEINLLLNSADVLLMTSFNEGSPQIIKEAMACGCPIVSTDVGDVKDLIGSLDGCFISTYDVQDVVRNIKNALNYGIRTEGRDRLVKLGLDLDTIANKLNQIYNTVLQHKHKDYAVD